jgi:hypothetical protein
MVRARCARVSSWRRIWRNFDAQWRRARGGRAERPQASAVQRVRVQPLLVLQESAQGQGGLPVLIAFRPGPDGPGMKEDVAPKRIEIVRPVKRFRPWNAVGRQHVVSPFTGGSVTELSVTDGDRWRTVTLTMPQRTTDSPVNIAQSRKFLELSSEACRSSHGLAALLFRASSTSIHRPHGVEFTIVPVGSSRSRPSAPCNAWRLCPLDMNLLQCPNWPGTEELSR